MVYHRWAELAMCRLIMQGTYCLQKVGDRPRFGCDGMSHLLSEMHGHCALCSHGRGCALVVLVNSNAIQQIQSDLAREQLVPSAVQQPSSTGDRRVSLEH